MKVRTRFVREGRVRLIVPALLAVSARAARRGHFEHRTRPVGGIAGHLRLLLGPRRDPAFTAAALSPAEGHAIFAYVAIAVYDSVMAIAAGYEPFVVDVARRRMHRPKRPSRRRLARAPRTTCPHSPGGSSTRPTPRR